ncbi:phosphonatase-like hydrolase [Mucilaginibacter sp. 44-25]|uniref:phosphonatase-like hydrolase n=1 Tax=Mucilaginibacter sp. 44-25 TaxID=1895794 RepID=UPI00095C4E6C|nr:phosphonatase-like hydrolase [Mucilaginibacter sp. 44-25]OJW17993.1 MAG: HAD family hydrolase [Mucilaginibacter sp. 44-25]
MSNIVKMVVFDMAGTTINEDNLVYKTLLTAINNAGYMLTLEQVLAEGAGKEKKQAIRSILSIYLNIVDEKLIDQIYDNFVEQLGAAYKHFEVKPQPNATELFNKLKEQNILTVLNTGYNRETAELLLAKLEWKEGQTFDTLVTASDVPKNRPNPDMIFHAMQKFGINDGSLVAKVGDSIIDIEEGKNAGCGLTIGITTGAHTKTQLQQANPDAIIDNLSQLSALVIH